ncbi:UPF0175 family protein [Desulfococcaceae bacterium HSG8]|nr:UPF0175 family protein [Desulfococcaceae bacterium HSG8]
MQPILIEIPGNIACQIKLPPGRAKKMIMEELAIRLYERGIITSAQASRLLEMDRMGFEHFLAENEIPIHGDPGELDTELGHLEDILYDCE